MERRLLVEQNTNLDDLVEPISATTVQDDIEVGVGGRDNHLQRNERNEKGKSVDEFSPPPSLRFFSFSLSLATHQSPLLQESDKLRTPSSTSILQSSRKLKISRLGRVLRRLDELESFVEEVGEPTLGARRSDSGGSVDSWVESLCGEGLEGEEFGIGETCEMEGKRKVSESERGREGRRGFVRSSF